MRGRETPESTRDELTTGRMVSGLFTDPLEDGATYDLICVGVFTFVFYAYHRLFKSLSTRHTVNVCVHFLCTLFLFSQMCFITS